jgi:hypothetical protein
VKVQDFHASVAASRDWNVGGLTSSLPSRERRH